MNQTESYLKELAPQFAQLTIWQNKFLGSQLRLQQTTLQKITASPEGYLTLSVYRPGDDRTAVILSIKKGESGILLTHTKPRPLPQPNSIVQIARKYLVGRRVLFTYASIEPVAFFIEFAEHLGAAEESHPQVLALVFEARQAKVVVAKKHQSVPERYLRDFSDWPKELPFFESYCEWSLDGTKTKRRATFNEPIVTYTSLDPGTQQAEPPSVIPDFRKLSSPNYGGDTPPGSDGEVHEFGWEERQAFRDGEMTLGKAFSVLPAHIRRAAKTKLEFLERRLLRQKKDLPVDSEIERLAKRAGTLQAHLYLWPQNSNIWYVPENLIQEAHLPPFIQLQQGQKPGDVLSEWFKEISKLKRRRDELNRRSEKSRQEIEAFREKVIAAGQSIEDETRKLAPHGVFGLKELGIYFSRIQPADALSLCKSLQIPWNAAKQNFSRRPNKPLLDSRRASYREYKASTGEFIRVARNAEESDKMLKMIPSHHLWLHVLTGEGSHVWLEKPKKKEPSQAALREAMILAVHHSRLSRGKQGEVRFAKRTDIEKKKDLPAGKVLVRRCETSVVKYDDDDLQALLARQAKRGSVE